MQLRKSYLGHLQRNLIINNKWPGLVSGEAGLMQITVVGARKLIYQTLILLDVPMCCSARTKEGLSCRVISASQRSTSLWFVVS